MDCAIEFRIMRSSKQDVVTTSGGKKIHTGRSKCWLLFEFKDKFCFVWSLNMQLFQMRYWTWIFYDWFDKFQSRLVHKFPILIIIFYFTIRFIYLLWKSNMIKSNFSRKYKTLSTIFFETCPLVSKVSELVSRGHL
jgi:hypothetical protein